MVIASARSPDETPAYFSTSTPLPTHEYPKVTDDSLTTSFANRARLLSSSPFTTTTTCASKPPTAPSTRCGSMADISMPNSPIISMFLMARLFPASWCNSLTRNMTNDSTPGRSRQGMSSTGEVDGSRAGPESPRRPTFTGTIRSPCPSE